MGDHGGSSPPDRTNKSFRIKALREFPVKPFFLVLAKKYTHSYIFTACAESLATAHILKWVFCYGKKKKEFTQH